MAIWVVGSIVAVAMLVVVLVALSQGRTVAEPSDLAPPWGLPTPAQVQHGPFPLRWQGYDPDLVDVHLAAVADAYAALYDRVDDESRRILDDRLRRARAALADPSAPATSADGASDPSHVVIPKVRHQDPPESSDTGSGAAPRTTRRGEEPPGGAGIS